jgi:hypothetical protein
MIWDSLHYTTGQYASESYRDRSRNDGDAFHGKSHARCRETRCPRAIAGANLEPNTGRFVMGRPTLPGNVVVADGLPLDRLYARFDAIARGRTPADGSAAHRSLIERLRSNRRRAEALGWTAFVLERAAGSGHLELRGTPPGGRDSELVRDAIPYDGLEPTGGSTAVSDLPHDDEGRIGTDLANLSWRSRMRWLDDGGR